MTRIDRILKEYQVKMTPIMPIQGGNISDGSVAQNNLVAAGAKLTDFVPVPQNSDTIDYNLLSRSREGDLWVGDPSFPSSLRKVKVTIFNYTGTSKLYKEKQFVKWDDWRR